MGTKSLDSQIPGLSIHPGVSYSYLVLLSGIFLWQTLMVCKTVLLESECIMRGFYGFKPDDILGVFQHLLSLDHIEIEDRNTVNNAMTGLEQSLDFADVLHHASYRTCESVASFDDKKFARSINKPGIMPRVFVPG